jgi:hypothetical protein
MRPSAVEIVRGLQTTLTSEILPEIKSAYGQERAQLALFLLENLAQMWDTQVENLVHDNREMKAIFREAAAAIASLPSGHRPREMRELASSMRAAARERGEGSLVISALAERNEGLGRLLERLAVVCEDAVGEAALEPLMPVRERVYAHLREVSSRGWTVWDTLSFRERMAAVRAGR